MIRAHAQRVVISFAATIISALLGLGVGWTAGGWISPAVGKLFGASASTEPATTQQAEEPPSANVQAAKPAPAPAPTETVHKPASEQKEVKEKEKKPAQDQPSEQKVIQEVFKQLDKAQRKLEKRKPPDQPDDNSGQ